MWIIFLYSSKICIFGDLLVLILIVLNMSKSISQVPIAINEPVRTYAPGSSEVQSLIATYKKMWS